MINATKYHSRSNNDPVFGNIDCDNQQKFDYQKILIATTKYFSPCGFIEIDQIKTPKKTHTRPFPPYISHVIRSKLIDFYARETSINNPLVHVRSIDDVPTSFYQSGKQLFTITSNLKRNFITMSSLMHE